LGHKEAIAGAGGYIGIQTIFKLSFTRSWCNLKKPKEIWVRSKEENLKELQNVKIELVKNKNKKPKD
jgi:hypothetical protein